MLSCPILAKAVKIHGKNYYVLWIVLLMIMSTSNIKSCRRSNQSTCAEITDTSSKTYMHQTCTPATLVPTPSRCNCCSGSALVAQMFVL